MRGDAFSAYINTFLFAVKFDISVQVIRASRRQGHAGGTEVQTISAFHNSFFFALFSFYFFFVIKVCTFGAL
jgi:hypothetical protein